MKVKLLAAILALAMVLGMMGIPVFAEAAVLEVGEGYAFATIADALESASDGDIIKLMESQTITEPITISSAITLTGNEDVMLTCSNETNLYCAMIYLDADAALSGLAITYNGPQSSNTAAIGLGHNDKPVVENCMITTANQNRAIAPYSSLESQAYVATEGVYTIKGNTIVTDSGQGAICSANFAGEISGNTFQCADAAQYGAYAINGVLMQGLTISGNTFDDCGIIVNGSVTIKGNTFTLENKGNAIYAFNADQWSFPQITIEENTFDGSEGKTAISFGNMYQTGTELEGTSINVSDNTFTGGLTHVAASNPDHVFVDGDNVYMAAEFVAPGSLQAAIDAAEPGSTLKLRPNTTYTEDIKITQAITLKGCEGATFTGIIDVNTPGATLDGINVHYEGPRGADPATGLHGNVLISADDITVKNCNFYGAYTENEEDGRVEIGKEFGMVWVPWGRNNIVFDHCTFQTNTMAIFPMADTGEITNCTFKPLDEGDTRKSLAINSGSMQNVIISGNSFYGTRIYTNNAEITENSFYNFTNKVVIGNQNPIELSGNYWGSEQPDLKTLAGEDNIVKDYYKTVTQEGALTDRVILPDELAEVEKTVTFEQGENANEIKVFLNGSIGEDLSVIENLVVVDMEFGFDGSFAVEKFVPANDDWTYELQESEKSKHILIYEKGKIGGQADLTNDKIELGTFFLSGYGTGAITKTTDVKVEQRSKDGQNRVISSLADLTPFTFEIARAMQTLTINVTFPNAVEDKIADYQDMQVAITGGDLTKEEEEEHIYHLGSDGTAMENGVYTINADLTQNLTYTVTVEGEGYRKERYSVNMKTDKELTFWNNVKDQAQAVEKGKSESEVTKNFLAGEIVRDGKINVYDLSAVVSYFGEDNLIKDHPEYVIYDLNRDGKVDSKDVAMVLVSWNE